ncbi:MAG: PIG-L domain-containing protein [Dehalococcoidales bacterium]|nr:PIG-L domain-containing protein [Dehalococcoidales bacterium]
MTDQAHALVFAPHADDAEGGVGGTTIHWINEGKDVIYVVCTNGDKGTSDPEMKQETLIKIREEEQLAAAEMMGVREVIFLRHPDQGLEDTPEFRKEIVRLIRQYRPDAVATTDPYRRYRAHRDHRITGQVVLDAVFPFARDLYAYPDMLEEGLQPHKVIEVLLWGSENPNYRSNITDVFDLKIAARDCHKSQIGQIHSPERLERLKDRYRQQAEGEEFELAESFHRVEFQR